MRILHHALSATDMPDRRLPCPTEQRTKSSKRKRFPRVINPGSENPFNPEKWQLRCSTKDEKLLTTLFGGLDTHHRRARIYSSRRSTTTKRIFQRLPFSKASTDRIRYHVAWKSHEGLGW